MNYLHFYIKNVDSDHNAESLIKNYVKVLTVINADNSTFC